MPKEIMTKFYELIWEPHINCHIFNMDYVLMIFDNATMNKTEKTKKLFANGNKKLIYIPAG